MALTYEKVINVISKKPDLRKDFEVNNLIPWFRKKSQLFAKLRTELLVDIIKNLQFVTKERDDLIIKQGEQGDCMYILLRGQVTIYILYAAKGDAEEDKPNQPVVTAAKGSDALRQQLGTFVTNLGAGATFGEVALMSTDCIRTASIIVNESTDLIVVDRELYNRSVKNVLKQEFEDKSNFVATNPYFQTWPPKYKKQLTMALQKETLPYEGVLTKQGDLLDTIYFILTGEIKVVMDSQQHRMQYSRLLEQDEPPVLASEKPAKPPEQEVDDKDEMLRSVAGARDRPGSENNTSYRRKTVKRQPQEVCLLGVNESLGDIEVLLDLDTYMQTALCTQRTDVLILEMKHYERLMVKRNPRTIDNMKAALELRLRSRVNKHMERALPLLRCLLTRAEEYNEQRKQQSEARSQGPEKHVKHSKTMGETFDSFVPPQGALVDMYGPGTVFHRIRQREAAKLRRQERMRNKNAYSGFHGLAAAATSGGGGSKLAENSSTRLAGSATTGSMVPDAETSDPVLSQLEGRMRAWLETEYGGRGPGGPSGPGGRGGPQKGSQSRVVRLHRTSEGVDKLKPGARVVLRPRAPHVLQPMELPNGSLEWDEQANNHNSAYV